MGYGPGGPYHKWCFLCSSACFHDQAVLWVKAEGEEEGGTGREARTTNGASSAAQHARTIRSCCG